MADIYQRLQGTASRLMKQFDQGSITYRARSEAANPWEDPIDEAPIDLDATANGVSKEYLSELITTSDIEVTAAVFGIKPEQTGTLSIDGIEKQIISIRQLPAAGTPVAWKIFVKG